MEKGDNSSSQSSSSRNNLNFFDAAALLGHSPFAAASYAHLAHMPSAFSLLGRIPPFPSAPPFGGLGSLEALQNSAAFLPNAATGGADWWRAASEQVRLSASTSSAPTGLEYFSSCLGAGFPPLYSTLNHLGADGAVSTSASIPPTFDLLLQPALSDKSPFFHSAFNSAFPLLMSPAKSSHSSSSLSSSKNISLSANSLRNSSGNKSSHHKSSNSSSSSHRERPSKGPPSNLSPTAKHKQRPFKLSSPVHDKSKSVISSPTHKSSVKSSTSSSPGNDKAVDLSKPVKTQSSIDAKVEKKAPKGLISSASELTSDSDLSTEESTESSDDGKRKKRRSGSGKQSAGESPNKSVPKHHVPLNIPTQFDGVKRKLIADQIRQKMRNKTPSSGAAGELGGLDGPPHGSGRSLKNGSPLMTRDSEVGHRSPLKSQLFDLTIKKQHVDDVDEKEQNRRRDELKQQLEAELKQQQLQLKLMKKAQAEEKVRLASTSVNHMDPDHVSSDETAINKAKDEIVQDHQYNSSADGVKDSPSKSQNSTTTQCQNMSDDSSGSDSDDSSSQSESVNNTETKTQKDENDESGSDSDSDSSGDSDISRSITSEGSNPLRGDKRVADDGSEGGSTPLKKRRMVDETELRIPLEHGWRRETKLKMSHKGLVGDVIYHTPCGKKLRIYPEVMKFLHRNDITDLCRDNFSFSSRYNVGDFLEARQGENGYVQLCEDEILDRISLVVKKRGRPLKLECRNNAAVASVPRAPGHEYSRVPKPPCQPDVMKQSAHDTEIKQRVEQQEMVRKMAEYKMLRKLQRQRQKEELRKQKQAHNERKKHKELIHFMKQQEKVHKQEQLRMEREVKAQQMMEVHARRRRKQEIDKMRFEETVKKAKEREMKRQQSVLMKEQEREWHKQLVMVANMERERRRQHLLLVKALEARKKQEERDKQKEDRKAEKVHEREKKLEMKRMEIQMAEEMKRPREDMELTDTRVLVELSRIPDVKLVGEAFADCVMVVEFLANFREPLKFKTDAVPSLEELHRCLLNEEGNDMDEFQTLVINLLQFAVTDPGVPNPKEASTRLGQKLSDIHLNETIVSEVLRLFIRARNGGDNQVTKWLVDKPMESLDPNLKASVLAFLCNELLCSQPIQSAIDEGIEAINSIRRDKWIVEGKLRKLKIVQSKKFNRPVSKAGTENSNLSSLGGDDEGNDSGLAHNTTDDKLVSDEDEESGNESDVTDATNAGNQSDEDEPTSLEECDKKLDKLRKEHSEFRNKVFEASFKLRTMPFGEDRYKRNYWVLPTSGGIYVEGIESGQVDIVMKVHECMIHPIKKRLSICFDESKLDELEKTDIKEEVIEENFVKGVKEEQTDVEFYRNVQIESNCESVVEVKQELIDEKMECDVEVNKGSADTNTGDKDVVSEQSCEEEGLKNDDVKTVSKEDVIINDETIDKIAENGLDDSIKTQPVACHNSTPLNVSTVSGSRTAAQLQHSNNTNKYNNILSLCNGDLTTSDSASKCSSVSVSPHPDPDSKFGLVTNLLMDTSSSEKLSELVNRAKLDAKSDEIGSFLSSQLSAGKVSLLNGSLSEISETKPAFLSIDSMLKKDGDKTLSICNSNNKLSSNAVVTSSASNLSASLTSTFNNGTQHFASPGFLPSGPFSAEQILKSMSEAQGQQQLEKTWFSILPKLPCNDTSITRLSDGCSSQKPHHNSQQAQNNDYSNNSFTSCFSPSPLVSPYQPFQMQQSPNFPAFHINNLNLTPSSDFTFSPILHSASPGFSISNSSFKIPSTPNERPGSSVSPAISELYREFNNTEVQPIPEDKQDGWWQITDAEQLKALIRCLNPRGIRERNLQKTLQKYFEFCLDNFPPAHVEKEEVKAEQEIEQEVSKSKKHKKSKKNKEADKTDNDKKDNKTDTDKKDEKTDDDKKDDDKTDGDKKDDEKMDKEKKSDETMDTDKKKDNEHKDDEGKDKGEDKSAVTSTDADKKSAGTEKSNWLKNKTHEIELLILEEVESLEERVFSASLQSKRMPQSDDVASVEQPEMESEQCNSHPMDMAKERLRTLELNIERRYLKPPLNKHVQIDLASIQASLLSRDDKERSEERSPAEDLIPQGLVNWRDVVQTAISPAELGLCVYQLSKCIAWEKSIMKVLCQICRKDDHEDKLLLCDNCDKGFHTYCFKPELSHIPDGNWYCYDCISKATCCPHCIVCGKTVGKIAECASCPRCIHLDCHDPPLPRMPKKWHCMACASQKNKRKRPVKKKDTSQTATSAKKEKKEPAVKKEKESKANSETAATSCSASEPPSKASRITHDQTNTSLTVSEEMGADSDTNIWTVCRLLLTEMESHDQGWPFLQAVNTRQFPQYKKYIKQPMDFGTMKNKLRDNSYKTKEDFANDSRTVFDNCETFNEDESEVGHAGHSMRRFFEERWLELFPDSASISTTDSTS